MITEDGLREDLRSRIPDLTEGEWDLLLEEGRVGEVVDDLDDVDYLVRHVRNWRKATRKDPQKQRPDNEMRDPDRLARLASNRAEALSAVLAGEAQRIKSVADFRREVLRGRLIKPERVAKWIDRRAKSEPRTELVTAPADDPQRVLRSSHIILEYAVPESPPEEKWRPMARAVEIALDSELDRLRHIGQELASKFGWEPALATTFVLTGWTPLTMPIRVRQADTAPLGDRRSPHLERSPIPAAGRIVLDVDPTVTPSEVAERYKQARASMIPRRSRRMGEKNLRLAVYAHENHEGTWEKRMNRWNDQQPEHQYNETSNFQRDAVASLRRLLGRRT